MSPVYTFLSRSLSHSVSVLSFSTVFFLSATLFPVLSPALSHWCARATSFFNFRAIHLSLSHTNNLSHYLSLTLSLCLLSVYRASSLALSLSFPPSLSVFLILSRFLPFTVSRSRSLPPAHYPTYFPFLPRSLSLERSFARLLARLLARSLPPSPPPPPLLSRHCLAHTWRCFSFS